MVQEATSGNVNGATVASVSATFGSTPTSGNVLIAFLLISGPGVTVTKPTGWAKIHTGVTAVNGSASAALVGYIKISAGTESGAQTWSFSTNQEACVSISEWSGCDSTYPFSYVNSGALSQASGGQYGLNIGGGSFNTGGFTTGLARSSNIYARGRGFCTNPTYVYAWGQCDLASSSTFQSVESERNHSSTNMTTTEHTNGTSTQKVKLHPRYKVNSDGLAQEACFDITFDTNTNSILANWFALNPSGFTVPSEDRGRYPTQNTTGAKWPGFSAPSGTGQVYPNASTTTPLVSRGSLTPFNTAGEKLVAMLVLYGTSSSVCTTTITPASGWTQVSGTGYMDLDGSSYGEPFAMRAALYEAESDTNYQWTFTLSAAQTSCAFLLQATEISGTATVSSITWDAHRAGRAASSSGNTQNNPAYRNAYNGARAVGTGKWYVPFQFHFARTSSAGQPAGGINLTVSSPSPFNGQIWYPNEHPHFQQAYAFFPTHGQTLPQYFLPAGMSTTQNTHYLNLQGVIEGGTGGDADAGGDQDNWGLTK